MSHDPNAPIGGVSKARAAVQNDSALCVGNGKATPAQFMAKVIDIFANLEGKENADTRKFFGELKGYAGAADIMANTVLDKPENRHLLGKGVTSETAVPKGERLESNVSLPDWKSILKGIAHDPKTLDAIMSELRAHNAAIAAGMSAEMAKASGQVRTMGRTLPVGDF